MKWLRRIIAEEVAKVEGKLTAEREQVASYISVHTKVATNHLEAELRKVTTETKAEVLKLVQDFEQKLVNEASVVLAEKNKLIAELHSKVTALEVATRAITLWKADAETSAIDHSLKVVK